MRKIFIIGTLHLGLTPNEELEKYIARINPDQIFVEITREDIDDKKLKDYPPEMVFVHGWAIKNGLKLNGFDSNVDMIKEEINEEDKERLFKEQEEIIKEYNWKDLNKLKNQEIIDLTDEKFVDINKLNKRQSEMLDNINKSMIKEGNILIITGCGHLEFFRKNLKSALFPLDN